MVVGMGRQPENEQVFLKKMYECFIGFSLFINIFSVAQVNDIDQQDTIHDFIDHPVISNAYPVSISSFKFFITMRAGIVCQVFNGLENRFSNGVGKFIQLLLGSFG